ncbi:MAG: hypothetical protein M1823_004733 [Watsoniomyces obsoletus]|nr:MAG: hypothetical protein M1823_004733 [Watsoniomyces obsoletus]
MYEIAEEIGLPASFVELRHAVTHDELPSVTVLRHAVNRSLAWLWDHYWQRIDEETGLLKDDETSTSNDVQVSKETFKDIFRPYIKWKIKQAREKKESGEQIGSSKAMNSTTSQEKEMIDRACRRCVRICRGNTKAMAVLASALLDTRLMIPANRTLRSSLTAAFQLWDPILKTLAIHQLPFLKTLVSEVVRRLSLPSEVDVDLDPTYEAIYLWLQHILYDLNWTSCRRSRGRHPVTSKDDLEIREASGEEPGDDAANSRNADFLDWDSIIAACLNGQNKWSLRFLEMVVLDGRKIDSMSKEQRDEMCHDWADLVRRALEERFPAGAMPPAVTDE